MGDVGKSWAFKRVGEGRVTAHWTPGTPSPEPDLGDMVTEEAHFLPLPLCCTHFLQVI